MISYKKKTIQSRSDFSPFWIVWLFVEVANSSRFFDTNLVVQNKFSYFDEPFVIILYGKVIVFCSISSLFIIFVKSRMDTAPKSYSG